MSRRHKAAQYDLRMEGETFALVGEQVRDAFTAELEREQNERVVFNADQTIEQARLRFEVREAARIIAENARKGEL